MRSLFAVVMVVGGVAIYGLQATESQEAREPLYHESLRPQFHFTARHWDEYQLHHQHCLSGRRRVFPETPGGGRRCEDCVTDGPQTEINLEMTCEDHP
ncbi:MAG: hypothetical protein KBE65_19405 [Phycisphaerae bacterium]|nr:hypothetical protein [Phycisphaerae bacterium]